jgi:nitrate reductase gamma subunit
MSAETVFWIVHLPMMVLFLLGMWLVFANWLKGSVNGQAEGGAGRKTGAVVRNILRTIFSRKLLLLIQAFFVEAWFNRRLFRNDWRRWISHFALVSGFLLLMALSGISALADKLFIHFWPHFEEVSWIAMWTHRDHPLTALLNEIGALLMTGGLIYFLIRRSRGRAEQLRTGPLDRWMLLGLSLILLTGWITTIVRLNSSYVEPPAYFSFISYPLALLFRWLPLPWDVLFDVLYVLHGLLTSVVIVTIPFSKFMHVVAGALVTMINQVNEDATRRGWEKGAAHGRA